MRLNNSPAHTKNARKFAFVRIRVHLRPCICACICAAAPASVCLCRHPCICVYVHVSVPVSVHLCLRPCTASASVHLHSHPCAFVCVHQRHTLGTSSSGIHAHTRVSIYPRLIKHDSSSVSLIVQVSQGLGNYLRYCYLKFYHELEISYAPNLSEQGFECKPTRLCVYLHLPVTVRVRPCPGVCVRVRACPCVRRCFACL